MKITNIIIKEETYQGSTFQSVYLITDKGEEIRLGTIKGKDNKFIITARKKEYKLV